MIYFTARHETEIAWNAVFERGGRRREANRVVPAAILETADDETATECVAGTDAIHYLDLIARRAMNLAFCRDDRAPAIHQHQWVLAERDGHRLQREPFLEGARDLVV